MVKENLSKYSGALQVVHQDSGKSGGMQLYCKGRGAEVTSWLKCKYEVVSSTYKFDFGINKTKKIHDFVRTKQIDLNKESNWPLDYPLVVKSLIIYFGPTL